MGIAGARLASACPNREQPLDFLSEIPRRHLRHLTGIASDVQADQRLQSLYANPKAWTKKPVLNPCRFREVFQ